MKKIVARLAAGLATSFAASLILAAPALAQVTVSFPWARATVPAQKSSGAFMQLQSAQDARLVGVSTPAADNAELHEMAMTADTMKMQQVQAIDLPAGKSVKLASGGYHIMLLGLKQQLKEGDSLTLNLLIETKDKQRKSVSVKVPVKPLTYVDLAKGAGMAHSHGG